MELEKELGIGCAAFVILLVISFVVTLLLCALFAALIHWAFPGISFPEAFIGLGVIVWLLGLLRSHKRS